MYSHPISLLPAGAWRSYLGGSLIARLHGEEREDSHFPEEWILSTVTARNPGREDVVEGLSATPEGASLKEIIAAHPEKALGTAHAAAFGPTPGVLVKLLDAAERLAVQVHPTREKAMELFGSPFGKTECWHIIDTRVIGGEEPCVYLGFKPGVTREKWVALFEKQDVEGMLDCLHRFPVKKGDTFLICGGQPHAIGTGCLMIEIQEPTDYTIKVQRVTSAGKLPDEACHQGLGFEKMFDCFDYGGLSREETLKRWHIPPVTQVREGCTQTQLVGYAHTPMFAMDTLEVKGRCRKEASDTFSGLYVLEGEGVLDGISVGPGDQFFLPAACLPFTLESEGGMKLLHMRGPKANL